MSSDPIKNHTLYQNLFENSGSVMLITDPDSGLILDANAAAQKFYGYGKDELIGMNMSMINLLPATKNKQENAHYFNTQHRLKDGQIKEVEVYGSPIDSEGRTVLCAIIHDISDKKQTEAVLRKKESTIRAMINATKSLVYLFDIQANIINLNTPGALLFNKSPREMIGKNFKQFFSENDFARLTLLINEVAETHEPINYQRKRDTRHFDVQLYPVFNTENKVDRICAFANDITDLKMSEKVMASIETAGGICHEMNQPLQVIVGNLELLKLNMDKEDPNLDIITTLMAQTEKLGNITKKLTNITRYETKAYIKGTIFDIDSSSNFR